MKITMLSSQQNKWLKGVLILLVIADHNDYIKSVYADFFRPLTIHVIGFFVIAFYGSFFSNVPLIKFIKGRFVRYMWPFVLFFTFYASGSTLLYHNIEQPLRSYVAGIVFGSFVATKDGGGGAFMWFLPALFGFVVVARLCSLLRPRVRYFFIGICFIFHIYATDLSQSVRSNVPFGLLITIYIVPLVTLLFVFMSSRLWLRVRESIIGLILVAIIAGLAYWQLVSEREFIEIGLLSGPNYTKPYLLLLNIIQAVFGLALLWALAHRLAENGKFIQRIGERSFILYLMHPLIFKIVNYMLGRVCRENISDGCAALVSFFFTLGIALLVSEIFYRIPKLSSFVFPRDASHLVSTFK